MSKRVKQSFIAGSLTSSAGIFISKALGLLYVVPFTALAGGEGNMIFYSAAYTYYDLLLQICTAGLPFAIAAMVAKYASKDDFKTVVLIKKLSASLLMLSGFLMALIFVLLADPLAKDVLGSSGTLADINTLKTVFFILAVAVILLPFLSSYRGFYQGLKELQVYAFSQVLEQTVRIVSLLGLGYIAVVIFKMDNIYAVYMAVLSTSIAALIAIMYYVYFDKRNYGVILRSSRAQEKEGLKPKEILKELFAYGLPYLVVSILGNSMNIVNNNFFMKAMEGIGANYETSKILLGIIQVNTNKLTSIPQVLAIGFSSGIVPYLTTSLEQKDWATLRKNVSACLDTVLYISVPLCFCLFALAKPIYFIMYGDRNLDLGADALVYSSLLALTGTISPICSSMMMTLKFRRKSILYLFIGFIVKLLSFYPLIHTFGYSGAITSSVLTSLVVIFLNLQHISNKYKVNYSKTFIRLFKMIIALFAMNGGFAILRMLGLNIIDGGRIIGLLKLMVYGVVGMIIYLYTTSVLKLPKAIFGKSITSVFKKVVKDDQIG